MKNLTFFCLTGTEHSGGD